MKNLTQQKFRALLQMWNNSSSDNIYEYLSRQPAPRFYVQAITAKMKCAQLIKGELLNTGHQTIFMYTEIYKRYLAMREAGDKRPPLHLFEEIVQQPAPSFYMEPISIKFIIERNLRYHGK